jgi:hypothetical protein
VDVLGLPIPDGWEIIFIFTLGIVAVKAILATFLSIKLATRNKKEASVSGAFLASVLFLMISWLASRLCYMYFDFFLTRFNTALYPESPNIWFWKTGSVLGALGVAVVIWTVDRKILQNKFKGILAIIMIATSIVQLLYPVATLDDFNLVSGFGIVGSLGAFLIPILFLWIGVKTPGLRKIAFAIAIGAIVYTLGNTLPNSNIITLLAGIGLSQDLVYLVSTALKITGLLLLAVGGAKFQA